MSFQSLLEFSKIFIAYLQEVERAACTLSKSNLKSAHDRTTLLFDSRGELGEFRKKISCKNKLETKFLRKVSTLPSKNRETKFVQSSWREKKYIAQTFTLLLVMFTPRRFKDPQIQSSS